MSEARAQVVGLGLIGSSIALALLDQGFVVTGEDLDEGRAKRALELGLVSALGRDLEASFAVIATPVSSIPQIATELFSTTQRDDLVVTDVGSVKEAVVSGIDHPRFVGGHPMAGSEQEGPEGADRDLFRGATWVLTPSEATELGAFAKVRQIVAGFGADVLELDAKSHDSLVALVSHVPHLAAATLMGVAADASVEHAALLRLAAGGFRDMTRIAAGDPAIWPDILSDNRTAVLSALDVFRARLDVVREFVATTDRKELIALLEYAKTARRNLPPRVARPETIVECRVPVPDRPGVLGEVTTLLGTIGVNIWDLEIAHSVEGDRGVLVLSISAEVAEKARSALFDRGYRPSMRALS